MVCELDPSVHAPRAHTPPLLRQALGLLRLPPPPVPFPPPFPALLPGWGLQKPLLSEGNDPPSWAAGLFPLAPPGFRLSSSRL